MFAKLLKYDYRATRKYGYICLITIGVATLIGSLLLLFICNFFQNGTEGAPFIESLVAMSSIMLMYCVFFVITLTNTAILVVCLIHYYKNLVTDEGYLTFTLPVTADQILLSKLANSLIWSTVIAFATVLSLTIIATTGVSFFGAMDELAIIIAELKNLITGSGVAFGIFSFIFGALSLINSHLLYYMAIFLGSVIAKKNKALAAIGCVFGVYFIYSTIGSIIYSFFVTSISIAKNPVNALLVLTIIGCVVMAGLNVLFYYLTRRMMRNSLNLP